MKKSLEYDYQNLNQLSYSKTDYDADFVSLYFNGIFLDDVMIFIDAISVDDLEYIILNSVIVFLKDLKALNQKGNPIAFSTYLCKCYKCNTLLLDYNPDVDAVKHNIYLDANKYFLNEDNEEVLEMDYSMILNAKTYRFKGCPKCETAYYIIPVP